MTKKREPTEHEKLIERLDQQCDAAHECARYLYGLADGMEAFGGEDVKGAVHRLRANASELDAGIMWAKFEYQEPRQ